MNGYEKELVDMANLSKSEKGFDTIPLKRSWAKVILQYDESMRLKIYDAITYYILNGEKPKDAKDIGPFLFIADEIEKYAALNKNKRQRIAERNRENGKKGGRPPKNVIK